jgi:transcriptional regulator with XRE-family HTH domain
MTAKTYDKQHARLARTAANITEAEWARRARISTSYKRQINKGLVPSAAVQQRLARAVGVPVEFLWPIAIDLDEVA